MREEHRGKDESKRILYEELEEFARVKIRQHLQDLLEQEVTEWLGREKSERKGNALEQPGYCNGYGKNRRFRLSLASIFTHLLKRSLRATKTPASRQSNGSTNTR